MDNTLYDISEVCKMLGTTSRTLRFYEEKGIVISETVPFSRRRKYTARQVDRIRDVLLLRKLGFPISEIALLQKEGGDLKSALVSRKAKVYALIDQKERELNLLNEALALAESRGEFGEDDIFKSNGGDCSLYKETVRICSEAIVFGNTELLYGHLSDDIKKRMLPEQFEAVRKDTMEPLGEFICFEYILPDGRFPNTFFQFVRYENLGLKIKFVFHGGKISGLWFNYVEL